jgi:hypothetical protein
VNKLELKFLRREGNKLIFTTNHERIKTVTYEADGTEEQFEKFLKVVLLNYYKRNGFID